MTTEENVDADSEETDSSDEYFFTLGNAASAKTPVISVSVNNVPRDYRLEHPQTSLMNAASVTYLTDGEIEIL